MNNELNEKDLERASGGGLLNVLNIDTINALGFTRHSEDEDASNCPAYELRDDFYGVGDRPTCEKCVYATLSMPLEKGFVYCMACR